MVLRLNKVLYVAYSFKHCSDDQVHAPVGTFTLVFKYDIGLSSPSVKLDYRALCCLSLKVY